MAATSAPSTLKFVGSDAVGLPLKRKQVQQACSSCRKRKKRCLHVPDSSDTPRSAPSTTSRKGKRSRDRCPSQETQAGVPDEETVAASHLIEFANEERINSITNSIINAGDVDDTRFVGYSNPEGIFLQAMGQNLSKEVCSAGDTRQTDVGVWNDPVGASDSASNETNGQGTSGTTKPRGRIFILNSDMDNSNPSLLVNHWQAVNAAAINQSLHQILPPDEQYRELRNIYRKNIHPIWPVFQDASLSTLGDGTTSSAYGIRLAVSLAASTQPEAKAYLYFSKSTAPVPFSEFSKHISETLLRIPEINMHDRSLDWLRILILVSLFHQPTRASDRHIPTRLCYEAIHHAQTIGLHLCEYGVGRTDENAGNVFFALWALDRLNAAMYGRPVVIHERDLNRDMWRSIGSLEHPCFRLLLYIIWHLDKVIDLYRPYPKEGAVIDMPVFEGLCLDAMANRMPAHLLATLEVLYHAVGILSVRQKPNDFVKERDEASKLHLPHPAVNARRSIAADRILYVVSQETVSDLPWVPYAISLALSVYYRKMRYSYVHMFRNRARTAFRNTVIVLRHWAERWTTARVMADLGDSVSKKLADAELKVKSRIDEGTPVEQIVLKGIQERASRNAEMEIAYADVDDTSELHMDLERLRFRQNQRQNDRESAGGRVNGQQEGGPEVGTIRIGLQHNQPPAAIPPQDLIPHGRATDIRFQAPDLSTSEEDGREDRRPQHSSRLSPARQSRLADQQPADNRSASANNSIASSCTLAGTGSDVLNSIAPPPNIPLSGANLSAPEPNPDLMSMDVSLGTSMAGDQSLENFLDQVNYFNHIDSSFDLSRVDTTFRANLDITWPQLWNPTWSDFGLDFGDVPSTG